MFKTISYDQSEILHAINALYLSGEGIDLDPMYGKGGFYKKFPEPGLARDLENGPEYDATDMRQWVGGGQVRSMILDPPFMHAQGKDSAMKRYASYPSQKALRELYDKLIAEASRVLIPSGILVFKCQDIVESGKQVWNHVYVQERAIQWGFEPVDLFILLARSRVTGHNHACQVHARRFHSYFWVFRKRGAVRRVALAAPESETYVYDANGTPWVQLPMEATDGA